MLLRAPGTPPKTAFFPRQNPQNDKNRGLPQRNLPSPELARKIPYIGWPFIRRYYDSAAIGAASIERRQISVENRQAFPFITRQGSQLFEF